MTTASPPAAIAVVPGTVTREAGNALELSDGWPASYENVAETPGAPVPAWMLEPLRTVVPVLTAPICQDPGSRAARCRRRSSRSEPATLPADAAPDRRDPPADIDLARPFGERADVRIRGTAPHLDADELDEAAEGRRDDQRAS